MTPRQSIAITYPCARATEALDRRFAARATIRGLLISTILSVNK